MKPPDFRNNPIPGGCKTLYLLMELPVKGNISRNRIAQGISHMGSLYLFPSIVYSIQSTGIGFHLLQHAMNQKQLAEQIGVNIRWVQKLEAGDTKLENITFLNAIKLIRALTP